MKPGNSFNNDCPNCWLAFTKFVAMFRLRYLPPLLILLTLIFICGKLLLTPVDNRVGLGYEETGWPWIYFRGPTVVGGTANREFSIGPLLADLAVCLAVVGVAIALLFWWHRRTLGRWQFSLRGIFAATLVAGLVAAWFMQTVEPGRREQRYIKQWEVHGMRLIAGVDHTPDWARRLLPTHMHEVFMRGTVFEDLAFPGPDHGAAVGAALEALADLPDVQSIQLSYCREPLRIRNPEALRRIESVSGWADDETLRALSTIPNLRDLRVYGAITDRGLEVIKRCQKLTTLHLISNQITDAGIRVVLELPQLQLLNIYGCDAITPETEKLLKEHIRTVHGRDETNFKEGASNESRSANLAIVRPAPRAGEQRFGQLDLDAQESVRYPWMKSAVSILEFAVMTSIFDQTSHRPWPMPTRRWAVAMRWHDLLFAHWPVKVEVLRPLIPPALEVDTLDGWAWIGLVPFRMTGVLPRPLPAACGFAFPELNVRTYVRGGGKSGVWFFSLDAASRVAVRIARSWYRLPYYDAAMNVEDVDGNIKYTSRRTHRGAPPAELQIEYRPSGEVFHAQPGTIEHWLIERYCLFSAGRGGHAGCGDIHHVPWPLQTAEAEIHRNTMLEALGISTPREKPLLHFARELEVVAWNVRGIG
jgi:uncharacterized protein